MELPAGLSVVKTAARPFPKTKTQPEVVQNADGTTAIYWLGVDFIHPKGSMRHFSAKVTVDACASDTLAVTALAYLVNATDLTAYCAEPLAEPAIQACVAETGHVRTDPSPKRQSRNTFCSVRPGTAMLAGGSTGAL